MKCCNEEAVYFLCYVVAYDKYRDSTIALNSGEIKKSSAKSDQSISALR